MANSYLNHIGFPRGFRNNNPFNVDTLKNDKWVGQIGVDGRFARFQDIVTGVRAGIKNAVTQLTKNGRNTPYKYFNAFAPKGDGKNNPTKYINYFQKTYGIGPNDIMSNDYATLRKLAKTHLFMEQAPFHTLVSDAEILQAYQML